MKIHNLGNLLKKLYSSKKVYISHLFTIFEFDWTRKPLKFSWVCVVYSSLRFICFSLLLDWLMWMDSMPHSKKMRNASEKNNYRSFIEYSSHFTKKKELYTRDIRVWARNCKCCIYTRMLRCEYQIIEISWFQISICMALSLSLCLNK